MMMSGYLLGCLQGIGRVVLVSQYCLQYGPLDKSRRTTQGPFDKSGSVVFVGSLSLHPHTFL